jgi:hypothetical protein
MREFDERDAPSPQQLSAYLDGELDAVVQLRVANWLAEHPAAAAELEALRAVKQVGQATPPPEPSDAAWATLLERIDQRTRLQRPAQVPGAKPAERAVVLRIGVMAAAVAAVVMALLLSRPAVESPGRLPSVPTVVKRLPVASDDDVEIISIDAGDMHFLAVGLLPLRGPFVLAAPGDVALEKIEQDTDGMIPTVSMNDSPGAPMIVAPLALAKDR